MARLNHGYVVDWVGIVFGDNEVGEFFIISQSAKASYCPVALNACVR